MAKIPPTKISVGERVRQLRQDQGLSQEQLAVKAGLYSRTIRRIEQGEDFTFGSLTAIAAALEVDPTVLISDDNPRGVTANLARAAAPSVEILRHAGVPQAQVAGPLGRLIILLAERYGLDPALKHVEVIPAKGGPTVYITADGWRFIAERSGELDGLTFENVERGEHGWRATALAWKKGCSHPFEGRAGCGFTENADDPEAIAMTRATRRALRTGFASRITVPSELAVFFSDVDAVPAPPDDVDDLEGLVPEGASAETRAAVRAQLDAEADKAALTVASTREWQPTVQDQTEAHKTVAGMSKKERDGFLASHGITDFSAAFPPEAVAEVLAGPVGVGDTAATGPAGTT